MEVKTMVVSNMMARDSSYNPKPKTKSQTELYSRHEEKLSWAKKKNTCPSCDRYLGEIGTLYDRGYLYGIECEFCR